MNSVNILLTIYALLAIYFSHCVGVSRTMKNILAVILGVLIGDLWL